MGRERFGISQAVINRDEKLQVGQEKSRLLSRILLEEPVETETWDDVYAEIVDRLNEETDVMDAKVLKIMLKGLPREARLKLGYILNQGNDVYEVNDNVRTTYTALYPPKHTPED